MDDSTARAKPPKPYPDFPLYAHGSNRWAKKIAGRTHYFGPWDNWQGALERYQHDVHFIQQGKRPPAMNQAALTVEDLVNHFLAHREAKLESGELARITFEDYKRAGVHVVDSMGRATDVESLTPDDFAKLRERLAERYAVTALGPQMQRCRAIFNFGWKNDLLDRPARMGVAFDKPARKSVLRHKQSKPAKIFTVDELRTLYHAAGRQMQAFILLGLNGGLGNADIGRLEFRHIQDGWIVYPRPKTTVERSFPLWPETAKAIRDAQQAANVLPFVFLTKYGSPWFKESNDPAIAKEFRKLCDECKLHQMGRGFYSLRHQFRTIADGCRDTPAVDHVMGHSDPSMGANYRQWIDRERLQAVTDHVRAWCKPIFRKPAKAKGVAQ
jgi:integrase